MKGMILAAGFGSRLKPLTNNMPKPLVPFLGTNAMELALWRFKKYNINNIAINAHYLSEKITTFVKKNPFKQNIKVYIEDELLGSGGAYPRLIEWLDGADLLAYNGDIISDINLDLLIKRHKESKSFATMALTTNIVAKDRKVFYDKKNNLVKDIAFTTKDSCLDKAAFSGIQILSNEFILQLKQNCKLNIINDGYLPSLKKNKTITSFLHYNMWFDLRDVDEVYKSACEWFENYLAKNRQNDSVGLMQIREQKKIKTIIGWKNNQKVFYDESCNITSDTKIEGSVFFEPNTVSKNKVIKNCIVRG